MQSLLWPEVPGLFTSNFGVAARTGRGRMYHFCTPERHSLDSSHHQDGRLRARVPTRLLDLLCSQEGGNDEFRGQLRTIQRGACPAIATDVWWDGALGWFER